MKGTRILVHLLPYYFDSSKLRDESKMRRCSSASTKLMFALRLRTALLQCLGAGPFYSKPTCSLARTRARPCPPHSHTRGRRLPSLKPTKSPTSQSRKEVKAFQVVKARRRRDKTRTGSSLIHCFSLAFLFSCTVSC